MTPPLPKLLMLVLALGIAMLGCQRSQETTDKASLPPAGVEQPLASPEPSQGQSLLPVTIYYRHIENLGLLPLQKEIFRHEKEADMVKQVIDHLSIAPDHPDAEAIWPMSTYVREVFLAGGSEVVIDFDGEFVGSFSAGVEQEELLLASLVNSVLDNFPAFTRVRILIDGKMTETFLGHLDIEFPLIRWERINIVVPEGMGDDVISVENLDTAKNETP